MRRQGGSLDIHEDSGQIALREAGLYDEFRRHTTRSARASGSMDKKGTVFIDHAPPGGEGGRPEIDRTVLRGMLIAVAGPGADRLGPQGHVGAAGAS